MTVEALLERVGELAGRLEGVERRRMFATYGWFVRGSLFAFVARAGRVIVRLPDEAAQAKLLAVPGAEMWRIGNKAPMRAWLALPEAMHDDTRALRGWLRRAWELAPAKKPRRPRT